MTVLHVAFDHHSVRTFALISSERDETHRWVIHADSRTHAKRLKDFWHSVGADVLVQGEALPSELATKQWDFSICHNAWHPTVSWISQLQHPGKLVWVAWGADYYQSYPDLQKSLYLPWTRLINVLIGKVYYAYERTSLSRFLSPDLARRLNERRNFIASVDYCSTLLDKHIPCAKYMKNNVRFLMSWYNTLPDDLLDTKVCEHRTGIVFGNSARNTNNHLDGILDLKKSGLRGEKIHAILSYGDTRYRFILHAFAKLFLGRNWDPLREKLPPNEYWRYLAQHHIAVFYNTRSQGAGNIAGLLFLQYTIFLSPLNPLLKALKDLGFHLYSTESLRKQGVRILEQSLLKENAKLAEEIFSQTTVNRSLNQLFNS
jgi:hypothetical protein